MDVKFILVCRKEQQEDKNRAITNSNRNNTHRYDRLVEGKNLLIENGFEEGVNFEFDVTLKPKMVKFKIGYGVEKTQIEEEVDICSGNINIIHLDFDGSNCKCKTIRNWVDFDGGGKVNCSGLQNYSARMIKPSTLLDKLNTYNDNAKDEYNINSKINFILLYTIEKYTELYPGATVEVEEVYSKYNLNKSTNMIKITFPSKSTLTLGVGREKDGEYFHKMVDAEVGRMDLNGKLSYLANQF